MTNGNISPQEVLLRQNRLLAPLIIKATKQPPSVSPVSEPKVVSPSVKKPEVISPVVSEPKVVSQVELSPEIVNVLRETPLGKFATIPKVKEFKQLTVTQPLTYVRGVPTTQEYVGYVETPIYQFKYDYPDVNIPKSEYGEYDVVRVVKERSKKDPNELDETYVFEYSPKAKHKIEIAGSTDNYDKYLEIVRSHPELAGLHAFAGPFNLDLAFASNVPGISGASEREEILIKQLHAWKGSPEATGDIGRMAGAIIQNPFVQISLAEAGGTVLGKLAGKISGYLAARYGPRAVQAFNIAQAGTAAVFTAPEVYSIAKKVSKGEIGEAASEAFMFGLAFGAGIEGYRIGTSIPKATGKYKGLTAYEAGFKKGMKKSKRYDPLQKEYYNIITEIKQDLRTRRVAPVQEEPTFTNVQALEQYNKYRADVLRTAVKNKLISLKTKAQISGGAGTEKVSTHDIDALFRSAKDPVILDYVARKLGIDPNLVFDPHQLPDVGKMITPYGTPKEVPYKYLSGQRGIRFTEQFYRLSESSVALAHKGRQKDILEAQRILELIYGKTGGVPKKMKPTIERFSVLTQELAKQPRIMSAKESSLLYESGFSKRFWDLRTKFYKRTLSKSYLNKQFAKLTNIEKNAFRNLMINSDFIGLPPSVDLSSTVYADVSSLVNFFSDIYSSSYPSPTIIKSSIKPSSKSSQQSKKLSSMIKSFYSSPSEESSSIVKSLRSPSSRLYSYPSPSPYPYPSSPSSIYSYPPSLPPKVRQMLGLPGLGRITAGGRIGPHAVKYINEYELIQNMMKDVIF